MSQSQASQRLSSGEIDKLVNDTIKYVLIQETAKYPVKRTDMTKHPMKGAGRQYAQIMKLVQQKMKHVFGLELVELENTQRYIVVNKFPSNTMAGIVSTEKYRSKNALLMVMLAHIFMAGGVVKEVDMWAILKKLKVLNEEHHVLFGDVKKLISQEFVRQMYLDLVRIPQTDPPVMEFRWGARSEREVDKEAILNFVCQMHSNMDPKRWTAQWKIVQQEKAARSNQSEEDDDNSTSE